MIHGLNLVSMKHFVTLIYGWNGPIAQKHVVVEKEPEIETVHRIHVVENHRRLNFAIPKFVYHNGVLGNELVNAPRKSFKYLVSIEFSFFKVDPNNLPRFLDIFMKLSRDLWYRNSTLCSFLSWHL